MNKQILNEDWSMDFKDCKNIKTSIPTSMYKTLLDNNLIDNPYYRDNELLALKLSDYDVVFYKSFELSKDFNTNEDIYIYFDGIDTISEIYLNKVKILSTINMHQHYNVKINNLLQDGINDLKIIIKSPTKYIKDKLDENYIGGATHAMEGFPHLRKAHCMFGWDWGIRLPDMGIFRDVYISNKNILQDFYVTQHHYDDYVEVSVEVSTYNNLPVKIYFDNKLLEDTSINNIKTIKILNPKLWYPNLYGDQHLYDLKILDNDETNVLLTKKIGLRTIELVQTKDSYGKSFYHRVNGINIFAMGANYIPLDNLISNITYNSTKKILNDCIFANFNVVRVWGGGYYPNDYFYELCDELGLLVWQDFMFSCANYLLTPEFEQSIEVEIEQNIKRIRHHASLLLWCGNNEMEMFQEKGEYNGNLNTKADYIKMFEHIIPKLVKQFDPNSIYRPSSPSSDGSFFEPNSYDVGDTHYWDIWHGEKPFFDFRKYYFRYLSEFGFQSFPDLKTITTFTKEEDLNIFSRVMEMHQRNEGANGKIMKYISQTYKYPTSFEKIIYTSMLLQAEAIKFGVEHFRANRHNNRCMGAIYWQLNDMWPVASWSSVDYYGRYKALHYYARRFFAQTILTCEETSQLTECDFLTAQPKDYINSATFYISSESLVDFEATLQWALVDNNNCIIQNSSELLTVKSLDSFKVLTVSFDNLDIHNNYLTYKLLKKGVVISKGTTLFCAPKHYNFIKPNITVTTANSEVIVTSDVFTKNIELFSPTHDFVLEDNFFDLNANETYTIKLISGDTKAIQTRSVYDIN